MLAPDGRVRWTGASNGCYAYVDTHPEQELTCIWLGNSWCAAADIVRIPGGELWIADSMALGIGPDRFWHQPWHCEITFVRDAAGEVVAMERKDGEDTMRWPRRPFQDD